MFDTVTFYVVSYTGSVPGKINPCTPILHRLNQLLKGIQLIAKWWSSKSLDRLAPEPLCCSLLTIPSAVSMKLQPRCLL